jgi:hypothetical protein
MRPDLCHLAPAVDDDECAGGGHDLLRLGSVVAARWGVALGGGPVGSALGGGYEMRW